MRSSRLLLVPTFGVLGACAPDNQIHGSATHQDYAAHLALDPAELNFGALEAGDSAALPVTMTNVGDATLYVESIAVESSGAFAVLGAEEELALAPGEEARVEVVYTAQREEDEGTLWVESTDPDAPSQAVSLLGAGLYPALSLTPQDAELGEFSSVCGAFWGELTLSNLGEARAEISAISVLGGVFSLEEPTEFPFELAPGEAVELRVRGEAATDGAWEGTVVVRSDDPAGDVEADLSATTTTREVEELFHQGDWAMTDVLLTVDRSCSMEDDAERLSAELPTLFSALQATGTDFQIAVITRDDGCHNETLFSPRTEDAESTFRAAVFGSAGSWTEAGLTLARAALGETGDGDCNDGLLRDGARVSVVHVSDEPEQSYGDWDDLVEDILALAPTAVLSAVAGPVPYGCATAAPGTGYDEAAEATGGFFANFCEVDWSEVAASLSALSLGEMTDTFSLSETPWPESLAIEVDGRVESAWVYDEAQNAVVFDEEPADGASIVARYEVASCD